MSTTFHLRVWTRFFAPPEAVWALKSDPVAIEAEFPLWAPFSIGDKAALLAGLGGALPVSMQGRIGPLAWPYTVDELEPGRRFRDVSTNALFSRWEHQHIVEATPDGARYIDAVTFTPALPGPKFVAIAVKQLFVARHQAAARKLPADALTVGVHVLRVLIEDEAADAEQGA